MNTHTTMKTSLSDHAIRDLVSSLKDRLQVEGADIEQRVYHGDADVTGPVVAICVNVSRLGTDVQDVLRNIKKGVKHLLEIQLFYLNHSRSKGVVHVYPFLSFYQSKSARTMYRKQTMRSFSSLTVSVLMKAYGSVFCSVSKCT